MLKLIGFIYFFLCCLPLSCFKYNLENEESNPIVIDNDVPPKYEDIN